MRLRERAITRVAFLVLCIAGLIMPTAPALAGVNLDGDYEGETSQDQPFRLTVEGHRVQGLKIVIRFPDCDQTDTMTGRRLGIVIPRDGKFRLNLVRIRDPRDTLKIVGEFVSRRRVEGTFRAVNESDCDGERVSGTWAALRT